MTKTHVRRILFEAARRPVVEVNAGGRVQRIGARRELILSGGSINSPCCYSPPASGPQRARRPGHRGQTRSRRRRQRICKIIISRALRSRPARPVPQRSHHSPTKSAKLALQWLLTGSGQMAVGATEATLFAKSSPSDRCGYPVPGSQLLIGRYREGLHRWPASASFSASAGQRAGEITLRDKEGRMPPRILANY